MANTFAFVVTFVVAAALMEVAAAQTYGSPPLYGGYSPSPALRGLAPSVLNGSNLTGSGTAGNRSIAASPGSDAVSMQNGVVYVVLAVLAVLQMLL
jgi:hypothetical protein